MEINRCMVGIQNFPGFSVPGKSPDLNSLLSEGFVFLTNAAIYLQITHRIEIRTVGSFASPFMSTLVYRVCAGERKPDRPGIY
ncbi:hypothetical protein SDC9_180183 [bioreactor metagenome]|uniref:Uncharacterized protein n=1 Tax=bioreactor metagenome TaxID=1076179 RepID=A0A645HA90_9ZZZZ